MIIFEILGKIFIEVIFEGILLGFWKLIGQGLNKLDELIFGNKKSPDPIKILGNKYLYKEIELTENLNTELQSGQKGAILEIINRNKVFAEFYDGKGNQIEWNNELVFEIGMKQFKLKK